MMVRNAGETRPSTLPSTVRRCPSAGISGTLALARAGVSMGKTVTIATDECNKDVIEAGLACKAYFPSDHAVHVAAFPARSGWGEAQESAFEATCMAHDHYIAVERAGANAQGTYCTMKGRSMDDLVAPLDAAFTQHAKVAGATTTGVGDGGNELGMGKVASAVEEHIPLGCTIACVGAADYLVAAGVSNWGAWGIIAAAQVMGRSQAEGATKDATAHPALPSVEEESALADALVATGCCDGIRGIPSRSVDGLDFDVHAEKLTALRELASPAEA